VIQELEQQLVDWLRAWLPDQRVEPYPDNPDGYDFGRGARKGLVLVRWNGSSYGKPKDIGVGHQDREIEFALSIVAASLRDHTGIYPLLEATRDGLAGWRPKGGNGFRATNSWSR
jgi:hypothetical protein